MITTFQHPLVGSHILRTFKSGLFAGSVIAVIHAQYGRLFRVLYSDGDMEDLTEDEVVENKVFREPLPEKLMEVKQAITKWHDHRRSKNQVNISFASIATEL